MIAFFLMNRPLTLLARQTRTDADLLPPRPGLAQGFDLAELRRQKQHSLREPIRSSA